MKYIEKKDIILEIGGNIGRVSILLSTLINDDKNLVVLESNNQHYNELLINKNQNGCNFTVLNNALSKYPLYQYKWVTFTLEEYNNIHEDERHLLKQINIISYEEIIENYNLNFNTLILDCEGAFYYIVKDYPEILKNIKKIIIENDFRYIEQYYYITQLFLKNNFIIKETVKLDEKYWDMYTNQIIRDNFYQVWVKNSE